MPQIKTRPATARKRNRWAATGSFAVVFCIMAALAMVHERSIFGYTPSHDVARESVDPIRKGVRGEVVNTTVLGSDILGYGGYVPLEIYITDGRIDSVKALPNNETSDVFQRLYDEGLMKTWDGHTLKEAAGMEVDGITGATYSSNAVIGNVKAGANYVLGNKDTHAAGSEASFGMIVALVVILAGATVPLFVHGSPRYRLVQQLLNVAVLGFWAGVFVDYAMMLNFFAHGFSYSLAGVVTVVLLIVGLLYPVFNRPGHYCAWICPFGSLQEIAGKICRRKIKIPPRVSKGLDTFRSVLWVFLLSFLFIGWGYQWIDYEIFTGFLVRSASWAVIIVGALFVILSLFVNRPFCRFVCPTGTLLRNS